MGGRRAEGSTVCRLTGCVASGAGRESLMLVSMQSCVTMYRTLRGMGEICAIRGR